jgi:transcriptional regulator with XRE-family HTH domain
MEESAMKELDYGKIGARIRQIRKAKGWSQNHLAKKCGISMSFLGHIERGTRIMSVETLNGICEALDASADELLWGIPKASETVMQELWNEREKKDVDSYAMYIRIMKSVAEIMGSA